MARELGLTVVGLALLAAVYFYALTALHGVPTLHLGADLEDRLVAAAVVLVGGFLVARSISASIRSYLVRGGNLSHIDSFRLFVSLLIGGVALAGLFIVFGGSVNNLFFGSAFVGIVLGLAGQTVLSNVFAGLTIIISEPFHTGERVSLVSASYGTIAPSYPHELMFPTYTGTIRWIGLVYTTLQLDNGRQFRIPNSVLLSSLVVNLSDRHPHSQRVRMTFPYSISVASVEATLPKLGPLVPRGTSEAPMPRVEVADLGETTWDAVVVLWTVEPREEVIRDAVLREVLSRLPAAGGPTARAQPSADRPRS